MEGKDGSEPKPSIPHTGSFYYYKNLFSLGAALHLIFSSFNSIQNLQTSISGEAIGLVSLTVLYIFFVLSTVISSLLVKSIGTKYTFAAACICHSIYVACNFYPSYFTLLPGSMLLGLVSGPMWTASTAYIAEMASSYAIHQNVSVSNMVSYFNGIFFVFFFTSFISGNVVSSIVYFVFKTDRDAGYNVTDECIERESDSVGEPEVEEYVLIGIYQLQDIVGCCVVILLLDRLPETTLLGEICSHKMIILIKARLRKFTSCLFSQKSFLPSGIVFSNAVEMGYLFGSFTLMYITECVGVQWVGFSLMCFGVSSGVGSLFTGRVLSHVPRFVIMLLNLLLMLGIMIFLLVWDREPNYAVVFIVPILWGICDSIWNTVTTSFFGIIFEAERDTAYGVQRCWQSLGFAFSFICSLFFNVLWLLVPLYVVTMMMFMIAEWRYSDEMKKIFLSQYQYNDNKGKYKKLTMKDVGIIEEVTDL